MTYRTPAPSELLVLAPPQRPPWHRRLRCWLGRHLYTELDLVRITFTVPSIGPAFYSPDLVRLRCGACDHPQALPIEIERAPFDAQLAANAVCRAEKVEGYLGEVKPAASNGQHAWFSARTCERV